MFFQFSLIVGHSRVYEDQRTARIIRKVLDMKRQKIKEIKKKKKKLQYLRK